MQMALAAGAHPVYRRPRRLESDFNKVTSVTKENAADLYSVGRISQHSRRRWVGGEYIYFCQKRGSLSLLDLISTGCRLLGVSLAQTTAKVS